MYSIGYLAHGQPTTAARLRPVRPPVLGRAEPVRLVDAGRAADEQPGAAVGRDRGDHDRLGPAGRDRGHRRRRRGRLEVRPASPRPAWAIALLGTIFAYYAGAQVLGQSYNLAFGPLLRVAARLPHTAGAGWPSCWPCWASAPRSGCSRCTPGCRTRTRRRRPRCRRCCRARCSRSASTRSCASTSSPPAALGPRFPRDVLLVFGVASLLLAALYLLDQRDYKRLLAYSSVEHMGILAIGVSFGAPIALAGVLLHVLAHAAAKGNAFMGAGVLVRKFGSKRISAVTRRPGPAAVERAAVPRSRSWRCRRCRRSASSAASSRSSPAAWPRPRQRGRRDPGGAGHGRLLRAVGGHQPDAADATAPARSRLQAPGTPVLARGEPSAWMVVPVVVGLAALLVLGLHPPAT